MYLLITVLKYIIKAESTLRPFRSLVDLLALLAFFPKSNSATEYAKQLVQLHGAFQSRNEIPFFMI